MGIVTIIDITEYNYQSNLIPLHLPTIRAHPSAGKDFQFHSPLGIPLLEQVQNQDHGILLVLREKFDNELD